MTRDEIQTLVITEFKAAGLDPCFGCAIIEHESNWNPHARSPKEASDEKYGGAYGLCQMLRAVAEDLLEECIDPEVVLWDPATNVKLFIQLTQRNIKHWHTTELADLITMHNSGKPHYKAPPMAIDYLKSVMVHYSKWQHKLRDPMGAL